MLCTWQQLRFNTLFLFADQRPVNFGSSKKSPSEIYIKMILRLAESLKSAGKTLRVFTDDPERLLATTAEKSGSLDTELLQVDGRFPRDMMFWAAHHKLNVLRRFAQEDYPNGLLDVDMVLTQTAAMIQEKLERPAAAQAWVYDISAQVFPAYSRAVVQSDLAKLGATNPFPRWYGGEFILGTPEFFQRVSDECDRILPSYLAGYKTLHHVGDEPVVSAALNACIHNFSVGDAGVADLVVRHWTGKTLHAKQNTEVLEQSAFWHLPDLKLVLGRARFAQTPKELAAVIRRIQFKLKLRNQLLAALHKK